MQAGFAAEGHALEVEILWVLRVRGVSTLQYQAYRRIEAVVTGARFRLHLFFNGDNLAFGGLGLLLGRHGARLGLLNTSLQGLNLLLVLLLHLQDHLLEFSDIG